MNIPKVEIFRTAKNGKAAIEIVVRNSLFDAEFHKLVEQLGYVATPGISNRRAIICTTPAEVEAARSPLIPFFNEKGEWK